LSDAQVAVSPGLGFGEYGDNHVRFALVENLQRTRQALRSIKALMRNSGKLAQESDTQAAS
jgi:alanine-synthesizing transaminase